MAHGLTSIALFTPIVASNAVFSCRRASRGADAIADNPMYGMMNFDIAAGQTLKGARAAKDITLISNPSAKKSIEGAAQTIKNISDTNKLVNGAGKVIKFTADNINPIICVTSGFKVLGSEDKLETFDREAIALTTMFAAEKGAKELIGMPFTENVNGNVITREREALYKKNSFLKSQIDNMDKAITDFCSTKATLNKVAKALPGALKGLTFVGASIGGYKLGTYIGNQLLGKPVPVKNSAA